MDGLTSSIVVYSSLTGKESRQMSSGAILSNVVFDPKRSAYLGFNLENSSVQWRDSKTGIVKASKRMNSWARELIVNSLEGQLYLGFENGTILGCPARDLDPCTVIGSHEQPVSDLALSPDGRFLFSADKSTLKVWDLTRIHGRIQISEKAPSAIALSKDGASLAALFWVFPENESRLVIWDTATAAVSSEYALPPQMGKLEFSPDHTKLATGSEIGSLWLVNTSGKEAHALKREAKGRIKSIAFSADGNQVVAVTETQKAMPVAE